jgi:nicotinate-nucleotide adenylyltransferase
MERRIGLFGGSFNPIHLGHLQMASIVMERLDLEKVIFIPAGDPPHKDRSELASAADRFAMVMVAIRPNAKFEISSAELKREGISYTIDTVREIRGKCSDKIRFFFIIGGDTIRELPTWRDIGKLVRLVTFVAVSRIGASPNDYDALRPLTDENTIDDLKRKVIAIDPIPISSTEIRDRTKRGLDISGLVPKAVEAYIRKKELYR